jgi:hypothetical protein
MTDQFGSFDGRDNRRTVLDLFKRLGAGQGERVAGMMRAGFLEGLIQVATGGFAGAPLIVTPCSAVEAYHLFVAITGCLGVAIEEAAGLLEEVVRFQGRNVEDRLRAMPGERRR